MLYSKSGVYVSMDGWGGAFPKSRRKNATLYGRHDRIVAKAFSTLVGIGLLLLLIVRQ